MSPIARPQLGTVGDNQSVNTRKAYLKHVKMFAAFLSLIGDFESLITLSEYRPVLNCPSIKANSITMFYTYNSKANMGLKLKFNSEFVLDQQGHQIECRGIYSNFTVQYFSQMGRS
jgi:hypothetical protein